jgi:hypothetical protein
LQDFLGTLQSFEAHTPKIPGQGYFFFPEIIGVHVNSKDDNENVEHVWIRASRGWRTACRTLHDAGGMFAEAAAPRIMSR